MRRTEWWREGVGLPHGRRLCPQFWWTELPKGRGWELEVLSCTSWSNQSGGSRSAFLVLPSESYGYLLLFAAALRPQTYQGIWVVESQWVLWEVMRLEGLRDLPPTGPV